MLKCKGEEPVAIPQNPDGDVSPFHFIWFLIFIKIIEVWQSLTCASVKDVTILFLGATRCTTGTNPPEAGLSGDEMVAFAQEYNGEDLAAMIAAGNPAK